MAPSSGANFADNARDFSPRSKSRVNSLSKVKSHSDKVRVRSFKQPGGGLSPSINAPEVEPPSPHNLFESVEPRPPPPTPFSFGRAPPCKLLDSPGQLRNSQPNVGYPPNSRLNRRKTRNFRLAGGCPKFELRNACINLFQNVTSPTRSSTYC